MSWKALIRMAVKAGATEVIVRVIELLLARLQAWTKQDQEDIDNECNDCIRRAAFEKGDTAD